MKRVYLITNYFHFTQEKESNRYRELAEMLAHTPNIELEVITSAFYQRTKTFRKNIDKLVSGIPYKVTFIQEIGYKKNISLQRLKTSKVFAKNTLKYLKSQPKADLIYQVVPTLDVANLVSKYAKRNNIPLIVDIQDLWPEAFKMAINIPVISDLLFLPLKLKANRIYKRADAICAVSQTYVDRALKVNRKCQKGTAAYIGINLTKFDENVQKCKCPKEEKITLAYCGSLEKSYDIKLVIDALSLMKAPPAFLIMGDGAERESFAEYAKHKGVEVEFTGFLPYSQMCARLCACDIVVNPIIGTSVASIINKHGDYAACGLPVINTQNSREYCDLVDSYRMGYNCVGYTAAQVAATIEQLMQDESLRNELGKNARKCAEEKFDRAKTYQNLVEVVKNFL